MFKLISLVVVVLMLLGGAMLAVWGIQTYNIQAGLLNRYEAKVKDNSSQFDNTWKTISQSAQVSDKQKDALKEIFTSHADARNKGSDSDQLLMKWVQESVPNIDSSTSIYRDLMNTVVSARHSWTQRQTELVDISRQYNDALVKFPTNIFLNLFGFTKLDAKVITSSRTEEAFATGRDDNTKLAP
jgi:hypothetical protein